MTNAARVRPFIVGLLSLAAGMIIWEVSARLFFSPIRLPPLSQIGREAFVELRNGSLEANIVVSCFRILSGFVIGSALGIALGLTMGTSRLMRWLFDPIVNFLRFIPPIAWITPFLIWFGIGETGKILLITYTVLFMVALNTLAGVYAIPPNRIRAARSIGANSLQLYFWVVVPSVMSHMLLGMRIAMANAFTTVVTAEMIAAQAGLGFLILVSKDYGATDRIMLGMITLGVIGLLSDLAFVAATKSIARRYR